MAVRLHKPSGPMCDWACMQIEKVLKALYVRKLYLWPRFQADIQGNLPHIDVGATPLTSHHLHAGTLARMLTKRAALHFRCLAA